jgi:hypothetical protein
MIAIPATRLLLVALAAAALALGGLACGDDDDSESDSGSDSVAETTERAETTTGAGAGETNDVLLSYKVAGAEANPDELGLVINAEGKGTYAIGQGRTVEFVLTPREIDGLRSTLDRVGFVSLPERIEPEGQEELAGASEIEISHEGHVVLEVPGSTDSPLAPVHAAVAEIITRHAIKSGNLAPATPSP